MSDLLYKYNKEQIPNPNILVEKELLAIFSTLRVNKYLISNNLFNINKNIARIKKNRVTFHTYNI
ncbi:hypothetical protein ABID14_001736 [Peptoniphilus olsenii]|uniref:Uncharacterized protein n=1 Tax=Peptoniphilus olsenii TaxID=411570 RepID=A0ABV2JCV2_9FIRM